MEHQQHANYHTQRQPGNGQRPASKLGGMRRKGSGAQRAAQALALFYEGRSYSDIARMVGYADKATAYKTVQRELEGAGKQSRELAAAAMEEHLRALWQVWYPRALAGEMDAAYLCVRLMERKAKFYGLDAPAQYEQVTAAEVWIRSYPPEWLEALRGEPQPDLEQAPASDCAQMDATS